MCYSRYWPLYFRNHVLLHEYAHHALHGTLLETENTVTLEPHPLSTAFQMTQIEPRYLIENLSGLVTPFPTQLS